SIAALLLSTRPFSRPMLCTASKSRSVSILAAFFGHAIHRPSAGASIFFSAGNRRSSSARRVVKKTSTSAPGFAPSFSDRSGTGEELALLLARERRTLLARFEAPRERVARRLLQRAEGQAGGKGAGDVRLEETGVLVARQPERQLHPGADARIEQRAAVHPHEPVGCADALERLAERQRLRRPRRVEDAARP